jgi:2-dehydropantoate 2-reductase
MKHTLAEGSVSAPHRHDAVADPGRLTVAVVGVGNIGGVVEACLREADQHDVIVCVRRPLDHLVLEYPNGTVDVSLRAFTDPAQVEPVDWVILCTKAHETASAAQWLERLCRPSTKVAVLQNGIDHVARVGPLVCGATVVPTIIYYNGERLAVDRVRLRHVSGSDLLVPQDVAGYQFAQLLAGTLLSVSVSSDFTTLLWRKLLINAVANPITALTRQRQAVLHREDIRTLCLAVLDEAVRVARADGAHLDRDEAAQTLSTLLSFPPEAGTSMYFDCLAEKPLEIEALTGAIVAAGKRHTIDTPLNRALFTLLRAVSDGAENGSQNVELNRQCHESAELKHATSSRSEQVTENQNAL